MIPRYQRILFWSLIGSILLMAAFLLHGCQQAHKRLAAITDATPIAAPTSASTGDFALYLANDADASITPTTVSLSLPQEPSVRARALLEHLLSTYALPHSRHPLQSGPAVDDVFLLNQPSGPAGANTQLAVINLRGSFVNNHPSGVLVENLTIRSIIGTLHDALPQIAQIRFLVDGQPHDTLAGHADLLRTYRAVNTTTHPTTPQKSDTNSDTPASPQP
jgi:hypothetical protein